MMFTPEELAEMAAADAEIEKEFRLTQEDLDRSQPGEGAGTSPELYAGIPRKKESRRRCWNTHDGKEIVRHPYYMGQERNRQDVLKPTSEYR